jgi:hypothetical protein
VRVRASLWVALLFGIVTLGAAPGGTDTVQGGPATGSGSVTRRAGVGVKQVQAHGQEAPPPLEKPGPDGLVTKAFVLKYKTADDAYLLLSPWLSPKGAIRSQPHQKMIVVTDTPEAVRQDETLLMGFDLPPRTVQVAVQLILASSDKGRTAPAPPPIRGVIDRLNALNTRWSDYKLVGDARVMGTEGERSTLRVGDDYRVDFRIDQIAEESHLIRFKPFELAHRESGVEGNDRFQPVLDTVLNLRDAQLFIVGASKMEKSNRALFMTITASVAEP